jgi:molybdenum cofactor biosynthesis enzyme MoaA
MQCPFCYVPFDQLAGSERTAEQVINTVAQWNPLNLTFGGGDPLMYGYFPDLVEHARATLGRQVVIQVDTNGLSLSSEAIHRIGPAVDVIGLPLETTSASIAARMRLKANYPEQIERRISELNTAAIPVKVNTVVTSENIEGLTDVGRLLTRYDIRLWSLYQFWPIRPSAGATQSQSVIPPAAFYEAVNAVGRLFPHLKIECGAVSDRAASYFFVTQTGRCYTLRHGDPANMHEYLELGSVFSGCTLEAWAKNGDPAANAARAISRSKGLTTGK